jgi:hypothetical protein
MSATRPAARWSISPTGNGWYEIRERERRGVKMVRAQVFGQVRAELVRDLFEASEGHDHDWVSIRLREAFA